MNFMGSSVFGNTIGVISLFIGVISLVITIFTFKKAELVEKEIKEIKTEARTKLCFDNYRPKALEELKNKRDALNTPQKPSSAMMRSLLQTFHTLDDFSKPLGQQNASVIKGAYNFIKKNVYTNIEIESNDFVELLEYLTQIINILEKGE